MKVLLIYAHPEPRSLNGAIKNVVVERLTANGDEVRVVDLYALGWKASADGDDFLARDRTQPIALMADSKAAFVGGTLTPDVRAQHEHLHWADAVILQFPLWWFTMPAILKGWVDRVYAYGLAYGVGEHSETHWGDRYGEGAFAGKRAMLIVTTGGWESHYSARGINGPMDDLLFPITHGILHYPGFAVLPSFVVHKTSRVNAERFATITSDLQTRIDRLWTDAPIAFRKQNGGEYEIPALTLKPGFGSSDTNGFGLHVDRAELRRP